MNDIILIGAGGHARSCIDIIEMAGQYKIAGLIEKDGLESEENLGYPIIGNDRDLPDLRKKYQFALITVGQIKSSKPRVRLFKVLTALDYKLPVIISPKSYVSKHSELGLGTIVMHNVIVNAQSKIGSNCILNNKALIEHDAVIGDHCHIATGAIINGNVRIGSETFIGSGAITKESISIGNNLVIGAGKFIKKSLE